MGRSKGKKTKQKDTSKEGSISSNKPHNQSSPACVIQQNPLFGRYLVAGRNLTPGELILEEEPIVVAPSCDSTPCCIGCYSLLDYETAWRCILCGFPLCSEQCIGIGKRTGHSKAECNTLVQSNIKFISARDLEKDLVVIGPLRCLIQKNDNPKNWESLCKMETHTEQRRNKPLWSGNQSNVVDVLRLQWGLNEFDEDTIHEMCGVLEVNGFEVGSNNLRAIYDTAFLFAHNCVPNTRHCDGEDFKITFRTTMPVRETEPLFVTYTYILQGTQNRRKHLKETKFFDCECDRCKDPSECDTNISALKCPQCRNGLVLSTQPLDPSAVWRCTSRSKQCPGYSLNSEDVLKLTERIFLELDAIDGNDIPGYEEFLLKYSTTLYENHFLCLSAKHNLFQLYGKISGYLINELSEELLRRKIELCKTLLEAFDKLDPGLSKQRGLIQYELHAPLMVLMERRYKERKANKIELKHKLKNVVHCLEEAKKILQMEPEGSEGKEIAKVAGHALDSLATWSSLINHL